MTQKQHQADEVRTHTINKQWRLKGLVMAAVSYPWFLTFSSTMWKILKTEFFIFSKPAQPTVSPILSKSN